MSWALACVDRAARLEQADLEHLARVVPLVHRRVDVQALVALEPDERRVQAAREDLGELRLADAGLPFEEHGPAELQAEEHGRRERALGDVAALPERRNDRVGGVEIRWFGHAASVRGHPPRAARAAGVSSWRARP